MLFLCFFLQRRKIQQCGIKHSVINKHRQLFFCMNNHVNTVFASQTTWITHSFWEGGVNTVGKYHSCMSKLLRPSTHNDITSVYSPSGHIYIHKLHWNTYDTKCTCASEILEHEILKITWQQLVKWRFYCEKWIPWPSKPTIWCIKFENQTRNSDFKERPHLRWPFCPPSWISQNPQGCQLGIIQFRNLGT